MRLAICTVILTLPFVLSAHESRAAIFVVSPAGDDGAIGDASAPFRTIGRAAECAKPGDTVLVRAGVYRERVTPPRGGEPGKPITYRGEKLGRVIIKGSDVWRPEWTKHNDSVYFGAIDEAMFVDDVYIDSANPFRVEMASTPHGRDGKPER
ncbi:MAG: DUF1565 domain-containing protein, partial [Pirellulaceae bacterium]|nr:DUF1565 domain-containing protein [Pirellulaceae bacterium]